ncbi:ATP-binding protein [Syntrophus aciditrophicus]|uniref:ATPase n=1 Tax=Syntrophus aciditrophicus (strain SB) TaxID=56780 RepID=Q2LSU5_SYNAS|nr:ATP-binding protein [Syntrophus aciditrophicus]ABC77151.1 ATPase [Syntrophus aciditrophicus SB]
MKNVISQLIDDFHERKLPDPAPRDKQFAEVEGKADVVIGMRRSGKTWFCYQKIIELMASGIKKEAILYLNFEDDRLLAFKVSNFQEILDVYFAKYPEHRKARCYFFFDEIQRIDSWEMFIRRLLDTENVQVFITGSSSKLLSSEIATSLRGRSLTTEIFPFSFMEYLKFHELFPDRPKTFGANTVSQLRKAVKDYLERGGFPEIQKLDRDLRIEVLQGYIDSVLLKDIIERHKVSNIQVLKYLVRHIMNSSGGRFSVNKFFNTMKSISIKCTKNSLYEYLDHLTDAFLFYKVPIHSRSERSRLINPPKIYTIDTGILNAMTFRNSYNYGQLLETMVFMHLRRRGYDVEYVHTKDGREADFLARHGISGETQLIQACWEMSDKKTFERELQGLTSAMDEHSFSTGTIVTWDDETTIENRINVIPIWKWLLQK